ncbi:MAG: shikimate dehydrogenase [Elusimicrobia bacterium CG1_02_37_114]|nr:MAG: shikimate dehydrogenase [Elusimicrobia bacterium CG1_02_37_114]
MRIITGKTKVVGVIGYPIEHTFSPIMHNKAFEFLGLDFVYVPFMVKPQHLKMVVDSLRTLNICGINVTIPYKEKIIKYLDFADDITKNEIGAVNTVVNKNGKFIGYNTDGMGFKESLKKKFNPHSKTVLLLGAGGAAQSIAVHLVHSVVSRIYIYDMVKDKASKLVNKLNKITSPGRVAGLADNISNIIEEVDLLINATPVGMNEKDKCVIEPGLLHKNMFVYDIVYNRETQLIKEAKKRKIECLDGIEMFLHQGAFAFQLWTGREAPIEIMRKASRR